jgi:quercetin dioxygenase-like cupin family protein
VTAGRISYAEAQQGGEAEHFVGSTGDLFISEPGVVHAVRAEMDSSIIVFTAGPRAGASYEDDTFRVSTPLF